MPDREKVIKALEFCTKQTIVDTCYGECPYAVADDEYKCLQMKLDALALLKEQEVMTPDKFKAGLMEMFSSIWDCEIDHPVFQDTVGELMEGVIQLYKNAVKQE